MVFISHRPTTVGFVQRLQLQDTIESLTEDLQRRQNALHLLDEEGKQAMAEQNRLKETFNHYTVKEARFQLTVCEFVKYL